MYCTRKEEVKVEWKLWRDEANNYYPSARGDVPCIIDHRPWREHGMLHTTWRGISSIVSTYYIFVVRP